ncbi:MAG: T9SS type A sorting domain-containing protein [Bacteroidales bacterium]
MKKRIHFSILFALLLVLGNSALIAQMPAAIEIQPVNATVYDEITLTLTLDEACYENGSLLGAAYVAIHSGITVNGNAWQKVVDFNGTGANGQSPVLNFVSEGVYAITYIPADFYGIMPNETVTQICAVFNNGTNWTQDARDFQSGGTNCADFFIPINPGSPPGDPFLHSIVPDHGDIGDDVSVQVFGLNTHFQSSPTSGWIENGAEVIEFTSVFAVNDTLISAILSIPAEANIGIWDVKVENDEDNLLTLQDGFTVEDTALILPQAITIEPPYATAYDELTLTLDTKLSCPNGGLFDPDSVMMHSGVTIAGEAWQYTVSFDGSAMNGQVPKLINNGDSTWSITFTPVDFYGFPAGSVVNAINCVFNGGGWTLGEAKDFDLTGGCIDFVVPIYTSTSIISEKVVGLSIFPNPVINTFQIKSYSPIKAYRIFSLHGSSLIFGEGLNKTSLSVNTSKLIPGVYILEISDDKNIIRRHKFIKR